MSGAGAASVVDATGLGKRYGRLWALEDFTATVPEGRVSALVGPNGAGKTTLLRLLAGLSTASAGQVTVLGRPPGQDPAFLADIGYLAQDIPLYKRLSALDHLDACARLNPNFDLAGGRARLEDLHVPADRAVATLSGGQRAQVALCLALAKRPRLLLLDEPVAALDPLARRQFLGALAAAVAEGGLTVLLSSHLVHDLERVCDHVLLLDAAHVQLCGDIEDILSTHRSLVGPRRSGDAPLPGVDAVQVTHSTRQTRVLARLERPVLDPAWQEEEVGLEDIILAYMGRNLAEEEPTVPAMIGARR
jgi:ABC-2 type transport system ATP-binding protein